jgi:AhpD family alkylhydroperoxidase
MTDARLDFRKAAPEPFAAMLNLAKTLHASSIPAQLRALVELRVSQINGCAYCCDMHAREARASGATELQLDCLAGWEEAGCFDERTRAALAWAEALTSIRETRAPRALYEQALQRFSERELAELTLIATTINAWNRIQIAFRVPPVGHR